MRLAERRFLVTGAAGTMGREMNLGDSEHKTG
jgi:hypothetical protein